MRTIDEVMTYGSEDSDRSVNFSPLTEISLNTSTDSLAALEPARSQAVQSGFRRADALVFLCVCIWAFNVPLVKACLQYFEPLEISVIRFLVGGLLFVVFVRLREGSLAVEKRHIPLMAGAALMGIFFNQVFFVYALKNTTSSEVSLLMAGAPTFATLLAWLFGQEKIRLNYWLSLPVAIAGVGLIILTTPGAQIGGGLFGDILAVFTAASWGAYTVMIRPLLKHYSAARVSAYVLLIGAIMLLPFGAGQFDWARIATVPGNIWLALTYSGLGAVVITNLLWFTGVKELGAPRTAFYAYLQPFVGVFAAFLILGETIVPWQIAGGLLVVVSMVLYRIRLDKLKLRK
ncbi:MAG TPA: EamA family transporter [Chloroflexia bacterium]|nr:EamA family transporter [Chloroflexia bacterium]